MVGASALLGGGMWWANAHFDWLGLRAQPLVRVGLLAGCLAAAAVLYFGVLTATGLKIRQMLRR